MIRTFSGGFAAAPAIIRQILSVSIRAQTQMKTNEVVVPFSDCQIPRLAADVLPFLHS